MVARLTVTIARWAMIAAAFIVPATASSWLLSWLRLSYMTDADLPFPSEGAFVLMHLVFPLLPVFIGMGCAYFAAIMTNVVVRKRETGVLRNKRRAAAVVVGAYLVTWILGVPAVQSEILRDCLAQYKIAQKIMPTQVSDADHPQLKFYFACPLLPGLIMTYSETAVALMAPGGEWSLYGWYFKGVKKLWKSPTWMS